MRFGTFAGAVVALLISSTPFAVAKCPQPVTHPPIFLPPSGGDGGGCAGTFPAAMASNSPFAKPGVQWHSDFRFPDPFGDEATYDTYAACTSNPAFCATAPVAKAELNFNWLMDNYGSEVAFTFMVEEFVPINLSNFFRNDFDNDGAEGAKIVNTYADGGNFGPAGTIGYQTGSTLILDESSMTWGSGASALHINLPFPTGGSGSPSGMCTGVFASTPACAGEWPSTPAITAACTSSIGNPGEP